MEPIVRALRAWLDGQSPGRLPAGVADLAAPHRLRGTLYHIGAVLGDRDAQACESAWANNLARHLERAALLARIWPASAPPPLVYKGADLAENLFDDPGARACVDLDLILPAPHFDAAAAHLAGRADAVTLPAYERHAAESPFAYGYRFGDLLIELHRDPQPLHRARLSGAAVWGRGNDGRLGRVAVRFPAPRDRALLWLSNQAKGAFYGSLADLLDLCLILRQTPGAWRDLRAAAQAVGLGRPLELAVVRLAASGLWSGHLPPADPTAAWIARRLPSVLTAQVEPPQPTFQAIKWWLCDPAARWAMAQRAAGSWRRRRSPRG